MPYTRQQETTGFRKLKCVSRPELSGVPLRVIQYIVYIGRIYTGRTS